jgi:ribosomal protein L29
MNDLTIDELKEKIEQVKKDLESLRATGDASRKLEILNEYKTYLEDELKMLKREQRP